MTDAEKAYLAGVVDGEGSIIIAHIKKRNGYSCYSARLCVANTDMRLMEWCRARGAAIRPGSMRGTFPHRKPGYRAEWCTRKALVMLQHILPFLVLKREQALLAIRLQQMNLERRRKVQMTEEELQERAEIKRAVQRLNGKVDG